MASIQWSDVTGMAPELSTVPAAAQLVILNLVNGTGVSVTNFGGEASDKLRAARVFLAAHYGTMERRRGAGGGINSQSEGDVSQSYFNAFVNPRALDMTSYGQMFRLLCSGTPARAGTIV